MEIEIKTTHEIFGSDFKNACLSKIDFPEHISRKIFNWVYTTPKKHFLVFCGSVGVGKTYTAAACYNKFYDHKHTKDPSRKEKARFFSFRYFTEKDFHGHLHTVQFEKNQNPKEEIRKFSEADYVMLDDLGTEAQSPARDANLFALVDFCHANSTPLFISTNIFLKEMQLKYEKRFLSRILDARNSVIEYIGPDKRKIADRNDMG